MKAPSFLPLFRLSSLLLALGSSAQAQTSSPPRFLGVETRPAFSGTPNLFDVDPLTGSFSNPRPLIGGASIQFGLAMSASGELYGIDADSLGVRRFFQIDRSTGALTIIANLNSYFFEGDLAFDPTSGILYFINYYPGGNAGLQLVTIDPANGSFAVVGDTGIVGDFSAMAFDAQGRMWVVNTANQYLLEIDKNTAAVLSSIPLVLPTGLNLADVGSMGFDPYTGTLYYADGQYMGVGSRSLYTVDTASGVMTLVAQLGSPVYANGLSGMVFPTVDVVSFTAIASSVNAGSTLTLNWDHGPSGVQYGIFASLSATGSTVLGQVFDLDILHVTMLSTGITNSSTGSYTTPPIPLSLQGSTVFFEMAFRDLNTNRAYDSQLVTVSVL